MVPCNTLHHSKKKSNRLSNHKIFSIEPETFDLNFLDENKSNEKLRIWKFSNQTDQEGLPKEGKIEKKRSMADLQVEKHNLILKRTFSQKRKSFLEEKVPIVVKSRFAEKMENSGKFV